MEMMAEQVIWQRILDLIVSVIHSLDLPQEDKDSLLREARQLRDALNEEQG